MKNLNSTYEPKPNDATLFTGRNNMGKYHRDMNPFEYMNREYERLMTFYKIPEEKARGLAVIRANYLSLHGTEPPAYYGIVG